MGGGRQTRKLEEKEVSDWGMGKKEKKETEKWKGKVRDRGGKKTRGRETGRNDTKMEKKGMKWKNKGDEEGKRD